MGLNKIVAAASRLYRDMAADPALRTAANRARLKVLIEKGRDLRDGRARTTEER